MTSGFGRPALVLLAAAAGWLDATAYLRAHVFIANMTGNTVLLGLGIGHHPPGEVAKPLVAVASFVAGSFGGSAIVDRGPSAAHAANRALVLEATLLALFAVFWYVMPTASPAQFAIIAIGALAMGIQQRATHRLQPTPAISTTYQGGTVERLGSGLYEETKHHPRTLLVNGAIWIAYLVSAVAVALLGSVKPQLLGVIPFAAILAVVLTLALRLRSRTEQP